jgi:predicted RNase H-like HicB family nuclease
MSSVVYIAQATGSLASGYHATFPDIPECSAQGSDLPGLLVNARQALASRLEACERAGDAWPTATPIEAITSEPGVMAIPIDIAVDDPPIRVNISMGERLVQRLDAAAEARGMTRSGFIAQSVRTSLGESPRPATDFDAIGHRLQDELMSLGRRINDSLGPDSTFSRRMNELDGAVYEQVRKAADSVSAAMARRRTSAGAGGEGRRAATAAADSAPSAAGVEPEGVSHGAADYV